ncbi:DEAD/DEAH box helicase [Fictibacillus barbaricus]|uniref:DEAD/DEAH box helicase family protein n=1 Tax=Fictibacillus barbaricus TaxID=182136 RepID=A0ABS2ZB11_9BACL|nr:DEAD/DEAH box helicase family protein [Fictibacillus barbaricus]MBN3543920.1 DEAD/DEAH box helicase family protein [Fictibacillus barbaricus]GGB71741.1 type III restriction endonuclease [Fictibacillus barbaricus]
MELKEYQKEVLKQVKGYVETLSEFKAKNDKALAIDPDLSIDFPQKAWEKFVDKPYTSKKNGLNEDLPNFCLKVPTGGGKTLLATYTIELINAHYLNKKSGFVLWVVPTTQIYRQTLSALQNREHPYRQALDISSGGRTMIIEKTNRFTPQDVEENLVIMLLMLPSANRRNNESLKIFQDAGGFESFFPPEDQPTEHERLLEAFPNLDYFGEEGEFFGKQIKTSLGNTLKRIKPMIIIDEGQRAYSENAQKTIRNFNPRFVVELSATPPEGSNVLVNVKGQDLNKEEMIKLDLHITNKSSTNWKDTLLASVEKRNVLEKYAIEYEANTGKYIRPIALIQVERTGKKQRGQGFIHADDAKEYLINECGISSDEIAIKTSETDDIEGIDLLSQECQIRYIITKAALQEGWDCSFAYVLTILTNPTAQTALTQLVGRILRQPYGRKTNVSELNESYVYCFQREARNVLNEIKTGLEGEGLGDLAGRIIQGTNDNQPTQVREETVGYREQFKQFEGTVYLPRFVIQEESKWREISYEMDLVSRVNWDEVNLSLIEELKLGDKKLKDEVIDVGLSTDEKDVIEKRSGQEQTIGLSIDYVFITRHLMGLVPNPWVAFDFAKQTIEILRKNYDDTTIASNLVFIVEELVKNIEQERDRLSEKVFRALIEDNLLHFFIEKKQGGYKLPHHIKVKKKTKKLTRSNGDPIQLSLFDYVPEEDFNDLEQSVAIYLDEQEKLLWWYRNAVRADYYIQGWKKGKVYPDFIFTEKSKESEADFDNIFVVETKGLHLKNEDTKYKQSIFALCNEIGEKTSWNELGLEFGDKRIEFQVVFEDEWKRRLNELFYN